MARTFLQLVNDVIDESKITLDHLTAANFTAPPRTGMYDRIKRWINASYKELYMKRPDWFFRKERANVTVWPRVHFSGLTITPAVGDVLVTQDSGITLTVMGVHSTEDAERDSSIEYTLSVLPADGEYLRDLIPQELVDRTAPTADLNAAYVKSVGNYSFDDLLPALEDIDINSVRVYHTTEDSVLDGWTFGNQRNILIPIPYDNWHYDDMPWTGDYPQYISKTPYGTYALYPQPDKEMVLSLDYTRSVVDLVNYDDVPEGIPDRYQDYLMWRAVQELGDFDNQNKLYLRASKHVEEYLFWMHRDQMPAPKFGISKFYAGSRRTF